MKNLLNNRTRTLQLATQNMQCGMCNNTQHKNCNMQCATCNVRNTICDVTCAGCGDCCASCGIRRLEMQLLNNESRRVSIIEKCKAQVENHLEQLENRIASFVDLRYATCAYDLQYASDH